VWKEKLLSNRARDKKHEQTLKAGGWKVLTLWECELANTTELKRRIRAFLK
jgi:DNA mismatch endonuclease (patch repair protein)